MPRYTIQRQLVSIGRDYTVFDEAGQRVFRIDGKLRFARTFDLLDAQGGLLLAARETLLSVDQGFVIRTPGGQQAVVSQTGDPDAEPPSFEIRTWHRPPMKSEGSFGLPGGIALLSGDLVWGRVARRPLTVVHEIFDVQAALDEDAPLVLAVAMAIAECIHRRGDDA